jgi:hypothetical protein
VPPAGATHAPYAARVGSNPPSHHRAPQGAATPTWSSLLTQHRLSASQGAACSTRLQLSRALWARCGLSTGSRRPQQHGEMCSGGPGSAPTHRTKDAKVCVKGGWGWLCMCCCQQCGSKTPVGGHGGSNTCSVLLAPTPNFATLQHQPPAAAAAAVPPAWQLHQPLLHVMLSRRVLLCSGQVLLLACAGVVVVQRTT